MTPHSARVDGQDAMVAVGEDGLDVGGRFVPWHAVDTLADADTRIVLGLAEGLDASLTVMEISHLGSHRDAIAHEMREKRGAARRSSLGHADLPVEAAFVAHDDGTDIDVALLSHGMVVEPRGQISVFVPWGLVADVTSSGYRHAFVMRYGDPVVVGGLGPRSDEFLALVSRLRSELAAAARSAAEADPSGLDWPDGWALADPAAVAAVEARSRPEETRVLQAVCCDLRAGVFTEGGRQDIPFLIGRAGDDAVVVEGVGEEDRATFVFAGSDVERVNAALLRISFRRDLLALPQERLGRWACAIRTQPEVAWLRGALLARVIHGDGWEDRLRAATTPDPP